MNEFLGFVKALEPTKVDHLPGVFGLALKAIDQHDSCHRIRIDGLHSNGLAFLDESGELLGANPGMKFDFRN